MWVNTKKSTKEEVIRRRIVHQKDPVYYKDISLCVFQLVEAGG